MSILAARSADARVGQADRALSFADAGGPPPAGQARRDPFGGGRAAVGRFASDPLLDGVVVVCLPDRDWYLVRTARANVVPCLAAVAGGGAAGPRDLAPYPPGSPVVVWLPAEADSGLILAGRPAVGADRAARDPALPLGPLAPDGRHQTASGPVSRAYGPGPDAFRDWFGRRPGVSWAAAGRPADRTGLERGFRSPGGLGVWTSDWLLELAGGPGAGLEMGPLDGGWGRLRARQWDLETAVTRDRVRDDEGEGLVERLTTPYPWEASGRAVPAGADWPAGRRFFRVAEYGGYLGQAGRRVVLLPGADPGGAAAAGVALDATTLDGSRAALTAGTFVVGRRASLPAPVRVREPESARGDDRRADNYRFAGLAGGGKPHAGVGPPAAGGDRPHLLRPACVTEEVGHLVRWQSGHPFARHAGDFRPEADGKGPIGPAVPALDYGPLAAGGPVSPPEPVELDVDHRLPGRKYHPGENHTAYLDDGSVVTVDGFGADDVSAGGSRRVSVPGDLHLRAGGTLYLQADQIVLNGGRAIDLTALAGAVRLAAATDVEVAAGLGGSGGVLVDARGGAKLGPTDDPAEGATARLAGVTLRSARGPVAAVAAGVYLRAGGEAGSGDVVLDAGADGRVLADGRAVAVSARSEFTVAHGDPGGPSACHRFAPGGVTVAAPLAVTGGLVAVSLVVSGGVTAGGAVVGAGGVSKGNPTVADAAAAAVAAARQAAATAATAAGSAWRRGVQAAFRAAGRVGADAVIRRALGFRFRDDPAGTDYRTAALAAVEPRWLRLVRLGKADHGGRPFPLHPAPSPAGPTLPWPGRTAWTERPVLLRPAAGELLDPAAGGVTADPDKLADAGLPPWEAVPFGAAAWTLPPPVKPS